MLIPVAGLLLLENLFRNADRDARWAIKHLCLAIGVIYTYDFFYFADAMFFGRPNPTLYGVRGFISAMMVPLIVLGVARSRTWPVAIHISRRVVFHSFALVGSGLYLLAMGVAGFYLRRVQGDWGLTLQIVFLIGAASILAVILASGSFRARARLFISRNFFSLKYDYRETWVNFIRTLSSGNPELGLQRRLLDAVANLMESTAGGLWVRSPEEASYVPGVSWNLGEGLPAEPLGSSFGNWLGQHEKVIELAEAADARRYPSLRIPDWLRTLPRAWLVVPLIHRDRLQGFMVLGEPRTNRHLDWEDYELLRAIGRQAASYIAEEQSANAVSDARQLELFSRRFAFVAHDLKNIVGQLSLMLRNAERFKENAQFQDDMVETVCHSIDRMSALLQQLRSMAGGGEPATSEPIALDALLEETAATWQRDRPGFSAELKPMRGLLRAPTEQLRSVLDHLVQNALDAAGSEGHVALRARLVGNSALIEVEDDGPGMDLDFVRQKLFRPLSSTKSTGFGIGAYQIREYVRSMGGRLEVRTAPGMGTTMQVLLPLVTSDHEGASAFRLEAVDA
jgi:putative PEP-CTERM system histidine kinase